MEFGLTTGRRVKKAESNLASYQKALKQHENKKVFETMMSLAQFGELTPERYESEGASVFDGAFRHRGDAQRLYPSWFGGCGG